MERTIKVLLVLIAAFLSAATAAAAERVWKEPSVEYSADSYMEFEGGALEAKIYHTPDKDRSEQTMSGEKMTTISRRDKKVIWMLMPDEMMYMETKITEGNKGDKDLSEYKIEETVVGEEVVNDIKTTKSKIIMTNKKSGEKLGGFWWITKEGIMVKMDMIAVDKNSKTRLKTELTNLKVGKQDPKLFEIPANYSKMSMP